MNSTTELSFDFINGFMVGMEAVDASMFDGEIQWGIVLDLGIFRFTLIRWNEEI
jgi:hypothetical protein